PDARAGGLSRPLASARGRSAVLRRAGAVSLRQGGCPRADPLYRARARARHAALPDRAARARSVSCGARRPRASPHAGDAGGRARRRRRSVRACARARAGARGSKRGRMILGIPAGELAWLAGMIVVAGLVTGILAGLFGIGGGAIIVPVLYEVF